MAANLPPVGNVEVMGKSMTVAIDEGIVVAGSACFESSRLR